MSSHQIHLLARDDPTDRELVQMLGQLDDLLERLGARRPRGLTGWPPWTRLSRQPRISCITGQFGRQLRGLQTHLAVGWLYVVGYAGIPVESHRSSVPR